MTAHGTVFGGPPIKSPSHVPWNRDLIIETSPLDTTGGHVWHAAYRLLYFFEEMWDMVVSDLEGSSAQEDTTIPTGGSTGTPPILIPGKEDTSRDSGRRRRRKLNVLELGAGCGWLGMAMACNLSDQIQRICMTEQVAGGGLAWLDHNIKLNRDAGKSIDLVDTKACDWNHYVAVQNQNTVGKTTTTSTTTSTTPTTSTTATTTTGTTSTTATTAGTTASTTSTTTSTTSGTPTTEETTSPQGGNSDFDSSLCSVEWDLIVGSDLVYNDAGVYMLPRVIKALSTPKTRFYYAHTKKRYEMVDLDFFEELEKNGLTCLELREPSIDPPPESPPPMSEVFPPMRIAVYRIQLAK